MRIFEHAFYNLAIQYRQHTQNPLIIDSTQVKNVYGVDVVDNTPTEVETLQKCRY